MAQDTLARRLEKNATLAENEINELMVIFGKGCRERTKRHLRSVLTYGLHGLPHYGIFNRVHLEPRVSYCAGQSYPDEIRTVRDCLLGR